jgi:hypothetical protein
MGIFDYDLRINIPLRIKDPVVGACRYEIDLFQGHDETNKDLIPI